MMKLRPCVLDWFIWQLTRLLLLYWYIRLGLRMYRARRHNHVRISMAHARYPGSYGINSVMLLVHRVPPK